MRPACRHRTTRPTRTAAGFTLVEIMIVILIIGVLSAIATPSWIQARTNSRVKICRANLKKVTDAKEQWAMETKKHDGDACDFTLIQPTYLKSAPVCPAGGTYSPGAVGTDPTCTAPGHGL